jgi:single-strand DNA-binding protein
VKKYTTEIVLQKYRGELQMLDSRNEGSSRSVGGGEYDQSGGSDFGRSSPMQSGGGASRGGAPTGGGGSRDLDDEIPF